MKAQRRKHFSAIDLFCGCGGLSLGLRRAGFEVLAAIDNDDLSAATYRRNHRNTYLIEKDIRLVSPRFLMEELNMKPSDLDLLAGCPPCQGFSTLRTFNGGRIVVEPMNELVFQFVRFVRIFLPKAIMMENVPGLLHDVRMKQIKKTLDNLGYECDADVFDAAKYGVPQRRLRMILIGSRSGCPFFTPPVRRKRTVAEAIQNLPSPDISSDPVHNYSVRRAPHVMSLIRRIPKDGGSRTDLPTKYQLRCHQEFDGFKDVYGRMAWREPSPTITGGCINPSKGRYLHPIENRAITLREAALLQSFPRNYIFEMSKGRYPAAQLIGNAFPPKFAEHHASSIYRHLDREARKRRS